MHLIDCRDEIHVLDPDDPSANVPGTSSIRAEDGRAPLPTPRGALSAELFTALRSGSAWHGAHRRAVSDDDAHIALWALYELHYRGLAGVDDDREWDPDLIRLRGSLEDCCEHVLRARAAEAGATQVPGTGPVERIIELIDSHEGPSIARFIQRDATREEVLEILRHRSVHHLKEADPTAWVVPRLGVATKAAVMELQYDEYGAGDPNRLHHHLFARGMESVGLRADYGWYVDDAPSEALAISNAMSFFGLNRRLRGASLGHLAAFEATSTIPCRQMAQGLRRLEFPEELVAYFDEHVEADAVHEQLALHSICGSFIEGEPELLDDVLLGVFTCLDLEDRYARRILEWGDVA